MERGKIFHKHLGKLSRQDLNAGTAAER
jgi:hypothetical protein